jgi:hypothetical protein
MLNNTVHPGGQLGEEARHDLRQLVADGAHFERLTGSIIWFWRPGVVIGRRDPGRRSSLARAADRTRY